jgi:cytochrome c peroxidase
MGEKLDVLLYKLRKEDAYVKMFKKAFNDTSITIPKMLKALAQFSGSLISANSEYDKVKKGEAAFSHYEQEGYTLFKEHCNTCHKEPLFTDNTFRNNGMTINRFNDVGRASITENSLDSLKFKVPTLRNVSVTFPYMHDGSKYSLNQVLDHYTSEIDTNQYLLDPFLKKRIRLSKSDQFNLISFLYCLTDSSFLHNPRFLLQKN